MLKVTVIEGIFLKVKDAKALAAWYGRHPGVPFGENQYVNLNG